MDGKVIDVVCEKLQWLIDNPTTTWSGIGNYALELTVSTVLAVASWCFLRKKKSPTPNQFNNTGGEQANLQGDHGIAKQINNYNNNVSPDVLADVRKLAVTESALASFFNILKQEQVPLWELDSKLREFACQHQELKLRLQVISSDDPEVKVLKKQAEQAFDNGRFSEVEELLDQIDERHDNAIHQLHKLQAETAARLEKEQLGKAENLVSRAKLQRLQYRYEKSAQYFQEAAAALPEGHKWERADYLGAAGNDFHCMPSYPDALRLFKQSLSIFQKIGDQKETAKSLNNIGHTYEAQGEDEKALDYFEQSHPIFQELGDKEGEGAVLNNISGIYRNKGDYPKALSYLKQSLPLRRECGNKEGEGITLNNIGTIYEKQRDYAAALQHYKDALDISCNIKIKSLESATLNNIGNLYYVQEKHNAALEYFEQALVIIRQINDRRNEGESLSNIAAIYEDKGDCAAALKLYKKSLTIAQKIGDKASEANRRWTIGLLYVERGKLNKAEPYISRAVELGTQLERPDLGDWREILEAVRAKLRGAGGMRNARNQHLTIPHP